jgi:uncharacterized protein YyaL (SSP411 family)
MTERAPNRLAREASPYLQQHAHNPVDWFPWGSEALAKAKAEDKPILLSIGYSACHWCHVMERESFEDDAIARQMNDGFVSIKVDREERPDLDHIYQLVVQLMGRSGGWPLTVFLTPDQRPFFAGTYFPPADRYGISGFPTVLRAISDAYREKRADVELQAGELAQAVARVGQIERPGTERTQLGPDLLARTSRKLFARFDDRHGGFGSRPKFPNTMCLDVLLRRGFEENDEAAKSKVGLALGAMRAGGIWDHLGGGFHRYSTDERWLVPHFEKMLYDNALLLRLYTDAFRAFGDDLYAATASDMGTYLLREMQSPRGGFYSAQDADSEGEEGKFFVWTPAEVRELLDGDSLAVEVVLRYFGITEHGNFESSGATVLAENRPLSAVAVALDRPLPEVEDALTRATRKMLAQRETREKPFRDEKILASWNGLVIAALADASAALGEGSLLSAAEEAFDCVEQTLVSHGRVKRLVKDDIVKGPGFLDDHAFVATAALDLYEATGNEARLQSARSIADQIIARFWDQGDDGFFFTPSDGEKLITRSKDPFDQSIPSGGSLACLTLLKLGAIADEKYLEPARRYLERIAPMALENPFGFGQTIAVLDRLVRGSTDIVILAKTDDPRGAALHRAALSAYVPNRNLVLADPGRAESMQAARLLTADKPTGEGAVAYVCRGRTCSAPITTPEELTRLLEAQ